MSEQKHDATAPARPDLEALRAAVARIEQDPTTELSEPAGSADPSTTISRGVAEDAPAEADPAAAGTAAETAADPYAIARAVVLRLLTGAPKSRSELETALRRKDCPEDVAAQVLDRYTQVGLVDDEAYARAFVRSKRAGRGLARRALTHELRAKGVPDEIAEAVLDEVDPEDERARALELVDKRLRSMHGLDRATQTRRLSGMLARKGYSHDVVRHVISEALDSQAQHQRD